MGPAKKLRATPLAAQREVRGGVGAARHGAWTALGEVIGGPEGRQVGSGPRGLSGSAGRGECTGRGCVVGKSKRVGVQEDRRERRAGGPSVAGPWS